MAITQKLLEVECPKLREKLGTGLLHIPVQTACQYLFSSQRYTQFYVCTRIPMENPIEKHASTLTLVLTRYIWWWNVQNSGKWCPQQSHTTTKKQHVNIFWHKKDTLNCVKVLSPLARGDTPSVVAIFGTNQKIHQKWL